MLPSLKRLRTGMFLGFWGTVIFGGVISIGAVVAAEQQHETGVIEGEITLDKGQVVAFRVKARDIERRISYTVYSVGGRYKIFNLPPGTYTVGVVEE